MKAPSRLNGVLEMAVTQRAFNELWFDLCFTEENATLLSHVTRLRRAEPDPNLDLRPQ